MSEASLLFDLVIAVHDPRRPVLRAIDSVLAAGRGDTRVTVVCHGLGPAAIPGLMEREGPGLRAVEFHDGMRSPAGPFNHGLDLATAEYVGVMGSDDWLAPGALDAWAHQARQQRLDLLLAGLAHQGGASLRNPPVRPWRRNALDPVRDRLFHRSAPLGMIRRELLNQGGSPRFTEGLPTGEDLALSTALFASAPRIGVAFGSPQYVIGADAADRVTAAPHSIETVLAPALEILHAPWFAQLPARVRTSALTSRLRGSVLANAVRWTTADQWPDRGLAELRGFLSEVTLTAPAAFAPLPRADRDLLDALASPGASPELAAAAVTQHRNAGRVGRLLPRNLRYTLHRESTPTRYLGYVLARLGA